MCGDDPGSDDHDFDCSSIERALSDIEIVRSAYPDETAVVPHSHRDTSNTTTTKFPTFPLHVTLYLSKSHAYIVFEWNDGYPIRAPLKISAYRSDNDNRHKQRIEQTVLAVRATAQECYDDGIEAGLACCSTAFETWNDFYDDDNKNINYNKNTNARVEENDKVSLETDVSMNVPPTTLSNTTEYQWFSSAESNMIQDRKSIFVGHVCPIRSESDVKPALHQLISNNNKLQRATHHMYAYRITEMKVVTESNQKNGSIPATKMLSILKYDSNDDGEDGAGIRLSQLLQLRNEMNVLVVVTRWFGGIHLGSKRFAHIVAAAQSVLVEYHATGTASS